MSTTAVRISEEILDDVRRIATVRGDTPGALLAEAWTEFMERHRDEISAQFADVARMIRDGDRDGLRALSASTRSARAEAAAAKAAGS